MFWNKKKFHSRNNCISDPWPTPERSKKLWINFSHAKNWYKSDTRYLFFFFFFFFTYEFALEQVPGNPVCAKRIMRRKVPTSVRKINLTFGLLRRLERWRKSHIGIVIAGKMASEKVWRKAESKKCESASNYQCPCIHWQVTQVDKEPIVKLLSRFKNQFWPWVCTDHCLHP